MDRRIMYSPLENGFYEAPFTVYEAALPEESTFKTLLGDVIKLPKYWTMNEEGIPITGNLLTAEEELKQELIINTNNPETPVETQQELQNYEPIRSKSQSTQFAMKYFESKGLKRHQAAGLVGNLLRESLLNPKALNKSSGAMGIALWLGDRKRRLISKYGKNPTLLLQLDFVWDELNSTHKRGLLELLNSSTVEQAAANAFGWFEFSVGPEGAVQDMINHGQNGRKSLEQGIRFAKGI